MNLGRTVPKDVDLEASLMEFYAVQFLTICSKFSDEIK